MAAEPNAPKRTQYGIRTGQPWGEAGCPRCRLSAAGVPGTGEFYTRQNHDRERHGLGHGMDRARGHQFGSGAAGAARLWAIFASISGFTTWHWQPRAWRIASRGIKLATAA